MRNFGGKRIAVAAFSVLLIIVLALSFCACNNSELTEGIVIAKTRGEALLFELGQLKMIDPRDRATEFVIVIQGEDEATASFYVSEAEYASITIGDLFVYDKTKHLRK